MLQAIQEGDEVVDVVSSADSSGLSDRRLRIGESSPANLQADTRAKVEKISQ